MMKINYAFDIAAEIISDKPFHEIPIKELCAVIRQRADQIEADNIREAFSVFDEMKESEQDSLRKFGAYDTPLSKENIDDRIDDWHDGEGVCENLHAHLGLSMEQYAYWVEKGELPCLHLTGYWIEPNKSFRCGKCGYQFQLADLPKIGREILTKKQKQPK
jgi:hypothetical protein